MTALASAEAPELAALFAKRPQLIKPGLARLQAALEALDAEALLRTPTVLIGGTNGKGTTSGFLWQLCSALGWKVGLFTSPHLVSFAERVQVSAQRIDNALLVATLQRLVGALPASVYEELSFFEVNTLLALQVFKDAKTDLNILEVGLGGRWDATNVTRPCLSIITSIGLDHQQWLGHTSAAIAAEKAGIMRAGRPVLWGGEAAGDAAAVLTLQREAATRQALFWQQGREFTADGEGVAVALPHLAPMRVAWPAAAATWPPFLRDNFAKATAALAWLLAAPELAEARSRSKLPSVPGATTSIKAMVGAVAGFAQVRTPPCMRARFERVTVTTPTGERPLLLDVCHNVDGARALRQGLHASGLLAGGKLPALVSILADKECDEILDVLRDVLGPIALFAVATERSWTAQRLAARHRDLPFFADFAAAWATSPAPHGGALPTVICGSVHAVGEVGAALRLKNWPM